MNEHVPEGHEFAFHVAELCSLAESLWVMKDRELVPLTHATAVQYDADKALAEWARRQGISCATVEEAADVLVELRKVNAEAFQREGE